MNGWQRKSTRGEKNVAIALSLILAAIVFTVLLVGYMMGMGERHLRSAGPNVGAAKNGLNQAH